VPAIFAARHPKSANKKAGQTGLPLSASSQCQYIRGQRRSGQSTARLISKSLQPVNGLSNQIAEMMQQMMRTTFPGCDF